MDRTQIDHAARLLAEARRTATAIAGLPPSLAPADKGDALAIQSAFEKARGLTPSGWKIGCTAQNSMELLGTDEPFPGRAFAPLTFDSPAALRAADFCMLGIEVEFAFRMAAGLPARAEAYSEAEVAGAVGTLYPAVEIVAPCLDDWLAYGVNQIIADNGAHGALVLGTGVDDWRTVDLGAHEVALRFDGREIARGVGAAVLGHPVTALTWLANHLRARGLGLAAGEVITTGTMTNINVTQPGVAVEADFGSLGTVSVRFD